MEKEIIFKEELSLIINPVIKEWVRKTLLNAPGYFYTAMASSTGKYHPACTCKIGGLIIHVKRAVFMANRLCRGFGIEDADKDIVIAAITLHDIAKVGQGSGSYDDYVNHPLNAEKYFADFRTEDSEVIGKINFCIKHHMGLWTPDSIKKPLKEYSNLELVVYIADFMATTKEIDTPLDGDKNKSVADSLPF